jgi:hypothetical protein
MTHSKWRNRLRHPALWLAVACAIAAVVVALEIEGILPGTVVVAVLAYEVTIALFAALALSEGRRRRNEARRPSNSGRTKRSEHFETLRDFMRQTTRASLDAYRSKLYARVRSYMNSRDGQILDDSRSAPLHEEERPGGRGHGSRTVLASLFVVLPQDDDPYWVRCNRPVEALRYCRRVHPEGFDVVVWKEPLPRLVRFVDLIG